MTAEKTGAGVRARLLTQPEGVVAVAVSSVRDVSEACFADVAERVAVMVGNICAEHPESDADGSVRRAPWVGEDGSAVGYTTERITGAQHHGRFAAMAHEPVGSGARDERATGSEWERVGYRGSSTRQAARARAVALFRRHSPAWSHRGSERLSRQLAECGRQPAATVAAGAGR